MLLIKIPVFSYLNLVIFLGNSLYGILLCVQNPLYFLLIALVNGSMTVQTGKWLDRKLHRNYSWIKKVNL